VKAVSRAATTAGCDQVFGNGTSRLEPDQVLGIDSDTSMRLTCLFSQKVFHKLDNMRDLSVYREGQQKE